MATNEMLEFFRIITEDSKHFLAKAKKDSPTFDIENKDAPLSDEQREIRWHYYVNKVLDGLISENIQLKKDAEQNKATIENHAELANEWVNQKSILVDQIDPMQSSIDALRQCYNNLQDQLDEQDEKMQSDASMQFENVSHSTGCNIAQELKLKPPTFDGDKNGHPMQFLNELRN